MDRGRWRLRVGALGALLLSGGAQAQDGFVFSLSGTGQAAFGSLEDQEIGHHVGGATRPWLRTATGAWFLGDVTGDGVTDEWNDVDALCVKPSPTAAVGDVYLSLLADQGPYQDGDLLRLDPQGVLQVVFTEASLLQDFGLTDGNCDLDAFQLNDDGTHWLSFAEDEASSVLSTDVPGQVGDGDLLWWTPASGQVGVVYAESQVDAMVGAALGAPQNTGDLLSVSSDGSGVVYFSVQSPSSHDGSVFSDQGNGTLVVDEATLGFSNTVELNALSWTPPAESFLTAGATPRQVPAGSSWTLDLQGDPGQRYRILCALGPADASRYPGRGFFGLFLSPADPLLWWSLGVSWLGGSLDGAGRAQLTLPPAPPAFQGLLRVQPVDLTRREFGTPIAVELG